MTFQDLGLIAPILRALEEQGYKAPSPIQQKAIGPALAGRDVLGCAQTGTGKTCAFAAPILQRLHAAPVQGRPIRALILTPTRELALQIQESFEAYGRHLSLRSAVIFGGVGQQPQVDKLKAGVDILVATPGRLEDLHNQGFIHVEQLEIFVLDEADRMLDMGFIHDVKKILSWLPRQKQTLFFSATMPPEVQGLVDSLLHDPVKVAVDPVSSPVEIIQQKLYYVDRGNKTKLLASLIQDAGASSALIFTRTKHGANKVAGDLMKAGITAAAIHGNKSQTARQQALADFKAGRIRALVATDIAARGIDIDELSLVFNYNLPDVPETYVHRIGRTGRAGRGGTAISFCDINEKDELKSIQKLIGKPIPVVEEHPWPMEVLEPLPRDKRGRVVNPEDAEARAAAKERRRERDAANKAAAQARKQKAQAPQNEAPAAGKKSRRDKPAPEPLAQAGTRRTPQTPAQRKNARGYRASSTLEEALVATAPSVQVYESDEVFEFEKPNPLASDVILDATARLLAPHRAPAPRRQEHQPEGSGKNRRKKRPAKAAQAPAEEPVKKQGRPARKPKQAPAAPAETPAREGSRSRGRKKSGQGRYGRPPELHLGSQKDSTEQPGSLMKPYYMHDN